MEDADNRVTKSNQSVGFATLDLCCGNIWKNTNTISTQQKSVTHQNEILQAVKSRKWLRPEKNF